MLERHFIEFSTGKRTDFHPFFRSLPVGSGLYPQFPLFKTPILKSDPQGETSCHDSKGLGRLTPAGGRRTAMPDQSRGKGRGGGARAFARGARMERSQGSSGRSSSGRAARSASTRARSRFTCTKRTIEGGDVSGR